MKTRMLVAVALSIATPTLALDVAGSETSLKKWLPCHDVGERKMRPRRMRFEPFSRNRSRRRGEIACNYHVEPALDIVRGVINVT